MAGPTALGAASAPAPPLSGRRRELDLLAARLGTALAGQARLVLVVGQPGIGKSRLLGELDARAAAAGSAVLSGGAFEAEGMPPYLPFLEALERHVAAADPAELRAQAGALAPVLATILPTLAHRLGGLPPSDPLPPEQARRRL